jgi:hypothetical protein
MDGPRARNLTNREQTKAGILHSKQEVRANKSLQPMWLSRFNLLPVFVCGRSGGCGVHRLSRHAAELQALGRNGWTWAEAEGEKRKKGQPGVHLCGFRQPAETRPDRGVVSVGVSKPAPLGRPGCLGQTVRQATSEGKRDRLKGCQHGGGMGEGRGLERRGGGVTRHSA